jgi:hypothetical protein
MARYEDWVPPPPAERISEEQQVFDDLLDRAIRTPLTMQSFFDSERPSLREEERVMRTLRLIEIAARADFLSALLLLGSPVLAWGAERHAAGTLEALARAAWILGHVPDTTLTDAAQRVTCVDLAMAIAERDAWRTGNANPERLDAAESDVQHRTRMHAETGCTCEGRDASTVHAVLQALTAGAEGTLAALPDVWTVLRAANDTAGTERLLPPSNGDALALAPYTHRGLLLSTVLNAYAMLAGWLLSVDHRSHAEMMIHVTDVLLESPEMQAAVNGDLDAGRIPPRRTADPD